MGWVAWVLGEIVVASRRGRAPSVCCVGWWLSRWGVLFHGVAGPSWADRSILSVFGHVNVEGDINTQCGVCMAMSRGTAGCSSVSGFLGAMAGGGGCGCRWGVGGGSPRIFFYFMLGQWSSSAHGGHLTNLDPKIRSRRGGGSLKQPASGCAMLLAVPPGGRRDGSRRGVKVCGWVDE